MAGRMKPIRRSRAERSEEKEDTPTVRSRELHLYSFKDIISYLNIFGSSNPRIFGKYLEWLEIKKDRDNYMNSLYLKNKIWRGAGVV